MNPIHRLRRVSCLIAAATLALPLVAGAQPISYTEQEPNNTLVDQNNAFGLNQGMRSTDFILGTGSQNGLDYFRVFTAAQPTRGIYRCTLTVGSDGEVPLSHLGLVDAGHNNYLIDGGFAGTGLNRSIWYTFGQQTSINYLVTGGSGPYRSTLDVTPVTITPISTEVVAGPVSLSMVGFPFNQAGAKQIVVYNSNFTPIPGLTSAGSPGSSSPLLQATLAPGRYYIGVCTGHMFNEIIPTDPYALALATPFVDTLLCDSASSVGPRAVNFLVNHGAGQFTVPATVSGSYGVGWYSLTVVAPVANDTCATATPIDVGVLSYLQSSRNALANDGTQTCNGPAIETPGVWYQFTGTGHSMTFAVSPAGDFNPRVHLYCAQNGCSNLTCVGTGDSSPRGVTELVTICTDPGSTYKALVSSSVSGFDLPTGEFAIELLDNGVPCSSAVVCSPRGACSVDGVCQILSAGACAQRGGSFCGENTSCDAEGIYSVVSTPGFDLGDLIGDGDGYFALGDDVSAQVNLPFAFPFYGSPKTSLYISSNGFLTFDNLNTTAYVNGPIPSAGGPNNAIYPFWTDLVSPFVSYQTRGTAPNRRFIVLWSRVNHYQASDENTFEAVLFEDGHIEFRYAELAPAFSSASTVGVENSLGTAGTSFNAAQFDGFFRTLTFTYQPGTPICTPPCRADFNQDGEVNPDDLADYIGTYFSQPPGPGSDFNADGSTDPDDLADYIGAYFGGC